MKATATALKERSLDLFKKALKDYHDRERDARVLSVGKLTCRAATGPSDPHASLLAVRHAARAEFDKSD